MIGRLRGPGGNLAGRSEERISTTTTTASRAASKENSIPSSNMLVDVAKEVVCPSVLLSSSWQTGLDCLMHPTYCCLSAGERNWS